MRIAVCDDNPQDLFRITDLLDLYQRETKACFTYNTYSDGVALLEEVQNGKFDLLFLDIIMPMVSGMEMAHEIREFNEDIKIIFLTSSPEFAVESYSVNAFTYLLKPFTKENLFPILSRLFHDMERLQEGLTLKFRNGVTTVLFSKLSYVEVMNKTLYFHLTDGHIKELMAPLADYEQILLSHKEFVRVHRSFIVNMWQIQELCPTHILTHSGEKISVSRRLYNQVREAYLDYLFFKKSLE
ncbi:MAG: LytTR family DNA-binding domain-containing protein [Acetivibrio sp.]